MLRCDTNTCNGNGCDAVMGVEQLFMDVLALFYSPLSPNDAKRAKQESFRHLFGYIV